MELNFSENPIKINLNGLDVDATVDVSDRNHVVIQFKDKSQIDNIIIITRDNICYVINHD